MTPQHLRRHQLRLAHHRPFALHRPFTIGRSLDSAGGVSESRARPADVGRRRSMADRSHGASAELRGATMRLGLGLGYSGARVQVDVQAVQDAERLGYTSVWTAESYGSDAVVPLAWVGALTYRIQLGTAILQMAARTPAMTAMTAMTLDAPVGRAGAPGPGRVRAPGGGRLARAAVRQAARPDARVRGHRARHPGAPAAARARRGALPDPVPGPGRDRTREAAPEHRYTRAPTCPSTSPRSARRTSRSPPSSPTAGCPCSSRPPAPASSAMRWPTASPVRAPTASGSASTWPRWRRSSSARTSTRAGPG